jgi:hypothetical protein
MSFVREKSHNGAETPGRKLPSGQELKMTFIIFAATLTASKHWAKIQRPFIGEVSVGGAGGPEYKDIRDLTEIVVTDKE